MRLQDVIVQGFKIDGDWGWKIYLRVNSKEVRIEGKDWACRIFRWKISWVEPVLGDGGSSFGN